MADYRVVDNRVLTRGVLLITRGILSHGFSGKKLRISVTFL